MTASRQAPFYAAHAVLLFLIWLGSCAPAFAQRGAPRSQRPTPFERYVPKSAKLFITIRKLGEVDAALRRAHAWRLLPTLKETAGGRGRPFDLRAAVTALIGRKGNIDIDEMMRVEVAIVAPSWSRLGSAVWFVRIPSEEALRRWFPTRRFRKGLLTSRRTISFRTESGMDVCTHGDVMALTRGSGKDSLLPEVRRLMAGRGRASLGESMQYRELVSYLPGKELAIAYVVRDAAATHGGGSSTVWPKLDRAAIGLYERGGQIDLAIRGSRTTPRAGLALEPQVLDQLMGLPQTTLFAMATTIDFDLAYAAATQSPAREGWKRYLAVLAGLTRLASDSSEPPITVRPHMIIAWGQDLSEHGSTPQLALMVQSPGARAMEAKASRVAGKIMTLVRMGDPTIDDKTLAIHRSVHLGTLIQYVPLDVYAAKATSSAARLLTRTSPAWAAWRDWFIVALSKDHLERILDARQGLIPSLGAGGGTGEFQLSRAARTVAAIAQPELGTDVLDRWLKDYDSGSPSLLAPAWWARSFRSGTLAEAQLGIRLSCASFPGAAVVKHVPPGSVSLGRLRVGDRIIGVDGMVLDINSPGDTLDRKLALEPDTADVVLRIQRGDEMIDAVVKCNQKRGAFAEPLEQATDALRELASLGRTLQLATFSVHDAGSDSYSAQLSLRFAPQDVP